MSLNGRLWNYRFSQSTQLIQETLIILKTLIVVKSIPIVQEVYNSILIDAELSFNSIIKCSEEIESQKSDCFLGQADSKKAETSLLFDLCVFAELGTLF